MMNQKQQRSHTTNMDRDMKNDDKSSPASKPKPASSSGSLGTMTTQQMFGINLAMELFGPSRVMEHLDRLQQQQQTAEEHRSGSGVIPPPQIPPVPPLYWRSQLFLPQRPTNSRSGSGSAVTMSKNKNIQIKATSTFATRTAKRQHQTLKNDNDQDQDDDDDFEYGKLWLWQALSADITEPPSSTTTSTSSPTTNDQSSNTKISHNLLYFDVTFDFVKPKPPPSQGATSSPSATGSINVSLGFYFLATHHPNGDGSDRNSNNNNTRTKKILHGEYIKTDPITSRDLRSHLESQQLDVSSVKPETLASIMAVEFLRCCRSRRRGGGGTRRTRSIMEVSYPTTTTSQQTQKVNMKIPYEDMMGVGLLSLTVPQDRDVDSDTTDPAVTRYANAQLRQMYHDLVVQNSHYYNEEQRHRGILVATSQEVNSSSSPAQSSQSNPSPLLQSNFSPSPGSGSASSSRGVGVRSKDNPTTKVGVGAKRKLDMINGRKNISSKVDGSRCGTSSGGDIVIMTLEDYKSKVVSAFEEWRIRPLTLVRPPLPQKGAVAALLSSSLSTQPPDVHGNKNANKTEMKGYHENPNSENGHAGTTAISEPTTSAPASGKSQPTATIAAPAPAALPPKLPKKAKQVYRRRRA